MWRCGRELNVPKSTVHLDLKKRLEFSSCKLLLLRALNPNDMLKRHDFASDILALLKCRFEKIKNPLMLWLSKKNLSFKFSCELCLPMQKKYYSETGRVQGKLPASFGVFQLEQGLGCTIVWGSRHSKWYLFANLESHWHPHTSPRVIISGDSVASCFNNNTAGNVRLPKLELKRFSGETLSWVSVYQSIQHHDP